MSLQIWENSFRTSSWYQFRVGAAHLSGCEHLSRQQPRKGYDNNLYDSFCLIFFCLGAKNKSAEPFDKPEKFCYRKLLTIKFSSRSSLDFFVPKNETNSYGKNWEFLKLAWLFFECVDICKIRYEEKSLSSWKEEWTIRCVVVIQKQRSFLKFRFFCVLEST